MVTLLWVKVGIGRFVLIVSILGVFFWAMPEAGKEEAYQIQQQILTGFTAAVIAGGFHSYFEQFEAEIFEEDQRGQRLIFRALGILIGVVMLFVVPPLLVEIYEIQQFLLTPWFVIDAILRGVNVVPTVDTARGMYLGVIASILASLYFFASDSIQRVVEELER